MTNNLTLYANTTNLYQMFNASSQISVGVLSALSLLGFAIILFISFKNFETKNATIAVMMLITLISILMWTAQLFSGYYVFICIALLFAALMYKALG